jgi:hypothetical protein
MYTDSYNTGEQLPNHWKWQSNNEEFIAWESPNNPFARIACRSRNLTPTACDGACWNCKKERKRFLETEPIRLQSTDILASWGDPYYELCSIEQYRQSLLAKGEKLHRIKLDLIEKRRQEQALMSTVEKKIWILQLQKFSPDISPTLH